MKTTPRTIARAEHIGSLLRPRGLMDTIEKLGAHKPGMTNLQNSLDDDQREELRFAEDAAIADAVRRQEEAGLDVVTDGEFRRTLFVNSFYDAIDGLKPAVAGKNARSWKNTRGETLTYPGPPLIERRLEKIDSPAAREVNFVTGITERSAKVTFPAGSWFTSPLARRANENVPGYDSLEELQTHTLDILKELITDAIDAGAGYVQLDFPPYPMLVDESSRAGLVENGIDPQELLDRCLWADRYVLDGLPDHVTYGLHLCRGNNRSSWLWEGSLDPIAEELFGLPYDTFLVEWDREERDGGFGSLRKVPAGPTVVLGIIDSKTGELETEDELLVKIDGASKYIDLGQLALSPQCGFASSHEGNLLSEEDQWRKLELVGRVAQRVWPNG